ncbi:MAG: ABC transporter ATP-binding protein [Verminephrobacter sp.]|nr:ABC transporter ATP-binding protein [Verminephrobacter sp.]
MRQLVNRHLLRQFWGIAIPYWRHEEKWKATGLLVLLVALLLGQTGFAVLFNEQTGEFTSALAAHDSERFWQAIRWCLALVAGAVPIYAFYYFVRDTLGNHWRRWLTNRFLVGYFRDRHFYELNARADIDNPDQRIAEDINTFTQRSLFFLLIFIGAALQLIAFSQVLWSIAHELVYFLVVYALAGTLLTVFVFGKPLIGLNFRQLQREADFRFSLVRVREKAEPIALYRGEPQERQQVWRRFIRAFDNFRQLIRNQLFLNLFQYGYSMLTIVLPSALIASRVLSGELEVGRAIQAAGAFAAVLSAISVVIENFEGLSRFAAGIDRLDTFFKLLSSPADREAPQESTIASVQDTRLALDRVTLQTPRRERTLIHNLSIDVLPGQGLLIVGASGSGKSSLLRALSGLWYAGSGTIFRPEAQDLLFLPQQPYMFLGTLRNQLLYPDLDRPATEAQLLDLLVRVNLPDLAQRFGGLDTETDWEKVLSIGEQQRLACARVLLVQPRFAILDEATSALDVANETQLYRQLLSTRATLVSVGHRTTLLAYHQQVLELTGDGHWRVHSAQDYQFGQ